MFPHTAPSRAATALVTFIVSIFCFSFVFTFVFAVGDNFFFLEDVTYNFCELKRRQEADLLCG